MRIRAKLVRYCAVSYGTLHERTVFSYFYYNILLKERIKKRIIIVYSPLPLLLRGFFGAASALPRLPPAPFSFCSKGVSEGETDGIEQSGNGTLMRAVGFKAVPVGTGYQMWLLSG